MQKFVFWVSRHVVLATVIGLSLPLIGIATVVVYGYHQAGKAGQTTSGGGPSVGTGITGWPFGGGQPKAADSPADKKPADDKTKTTASNAPAKTPAKSSATTPATVGVSAGGSAVTGGTTPPSTANNGTSGSAGSDSSATAGGPACTDPSGECMPTGDITGWKQIFKDNFTVNAATGSWGTSDSHAVVYTGESGGKWAVYPDGWSSTYTSGQPGYYPSQVLSVHDGTLDFFLHSYNGRPAGANPTPMIGGTTPMQTYGRYSARLKVTYDDATKMSAYHMAWLLWPSSDSNYKYAESDFPEMRLDSTQACAYAHYGGSGAQDIYCKPIDQTQWHTYTQEWGVGYRKYYIDGTLIGTSTNQIWNQTERWQLQTEPSGVSNAGSGHLLVDWVAVYAPAP